MRYVQPIKDKETLQDFKDYFQATNERNYIMFLCGIGFGLRISDVLKLKVKDVYKKSSLKIEEEKTGKYKSIVISYELKRALNEYCKGKKPNDYLFASRSRTETGRQKPIDRSQAYRILRKAAKEIGYTGDIGTHTLRKTFGYTYYKKTGNLAALMKIFNHTDEHVTYRYIGIEQEEIDNVIMHLYD